MSRRRVFHIVTHFGLGGAEVIAMNIARSDNPKFEYHLVEVVRGKGQFADGYIKSAEDCGISLHRAHVKNKKLGIILFPFRFLAIYLKYHPSVIHSHTEIPDLSVFLFYKLFGWGFKGTRYLRTIHNTLLWDQWGRIGKIVEPFFIAHHSNIAISIAVRDEYCKIWQENPPIIYNGISEVEQKAFPDIDHSKLNVLFAGRLEQQKGVDELIDVIKRCQDKQLLAFYVIGDGSLHRKLSDGLSGMMNVFYHKQVYGLSSFLSSFDYLFMPSNFEGLGLLSIEASMARVPAIINDCPGLNETLPDDWPLKVQANDVDQYLEIINHLDRFDRQELGIQAFHFVKDRFSIEKMQHSYELHYDN